MALQVVSCCRKPILVSPVHLVLQGTDFEGSFFFLVLFVLSFFFLNLIGFFFSFNEVLDLEWNVLFLG